MVLRRGVFTPRSIQTLIQTAMARLEEMGEPEQLAGFTVPTAKSREDIELLRGKEEYSKYAEMLFTCINRAIAAFRQENGEAWFSQSYFPPLVRDRASSGTYLLKSF